jgi:methenyltetrahydromethanopterin cyclohydrolase
VNLNQQAAGLCEQVIYDADRLRVQLHVMRSGAKVLDFGTGGPGNRAGAVGGLEAGTRLAEICMAGLGLVRVVPASADLSSGPAVAVITDHPLAACMASQYAGWQISKGKFFAMGSGPMRAVAAKEELFRNICTPEKSTVAVGVLETRTLPSDEVCRELAADCSVEPEKLTLLVAPTASQAGGLQVVARAIETALHKLHELGFDLWRVESGYGVAPLPPVAENDLAAIGRTNDAILYGGEVTLWVRGDDESLQVIGPKVPSSGSPDHGQTFATIFERYDRDFYKIDPHLFSPAAVTFNNLDSGKSYRFGRLVPRVIHESFDLR